MEKAEKISIREYSKERHVSYEAVRRQVVRYEKELKGHTEKTDQKILLDEWAVNFLDKHRMQRNVVQIASDDEIQNELNRLKEQVAQLQNKLFETEQKLIESHEEQKKLIADGAKADAMLMLAERDREELKETKQVLQDTKVEFEVMKVTLNHTEQEKEQAIQELNKYHKSIFGFYRKEA